jgi:hypothetical protein
VEDGDLATTMPLAQDPCPRVVGRDNRVAAPNCHPLNQVLDARQCMSYAIIIRRCLAIQLMCVVDE